MWTAFVVALAFGVQPAQAGTALTLAHPRFTFGPAGATRPDNKYLPGDVVHLAFGVGGLKFDGEAQANYRIAMEVSDAAGQALFRQKPYAAQAKNVLGGKTMPCAVQVQLPPDQPAGTYTVKVTVEDAATSQSQSLTHKFEVLPAAFGLVRVGTSASNDGTTPVASAGTEGGTLYVAFAAVGFGRGKAKQPDFAVALRMLDEGGKPTTAQALTGKVNENVAEGVNLVPLQFGVTLNRVGRFTLELTATDHVSGRTARVALPLKVTAAD